MNAPGTRRALVALTGGVAAATFAVSAHGLYLYGRDVMRVGELAPLVPAGVDMASLVALLSAHLRTGERWTRRGYAWLVFIATGLLSVAGNLADGAQRHLPVAGLVGVAAAPVTFLLVSHLAITSWHSGRPVTTGPLEDDHGAEVDEPAVDPWEYAEPVGELPQRAASDTRDEASSDGPPKLAPSAEVIARIRHRSPQLKQEEVARRARVSLSTVKRHWPVTAPPVEVSPVNGHRVPALITQSTEPTDGR